MPSGTVYLYTFYAVPVTAVPLDLAYDEMSIAQQIALLDEEEREKVLAGFDLARLRYDWSFWGRPAQIFPKNNDWWLGLTMAGRGSGKTRGGSEWAHDKAMSMPGSRGLLVARTAADTRDTIVEGDSGLLHVGQPQDRAKVRVLQAPGHLAQRLPGNAFPRQPSRPSPWRPLPPSPRRTRSPPSLG